MVERPGPSPDQSDTIADVPRPDVDTQPRAGAVAHAESHPRAASQAKPRAPSQRGEALTVRPEPAGVERPSPFAGLLAEARQPSTELQALEEKAKKASQAREPTLAVRERSTLPLPAVPPPAERKIGPYRVLGLLGEGGMAVVYKAAQPALDRLVALKELRAEYVHDRQIMARFEREAQSLATLQHGNIVHVYDFIRDPESAYIVMEHVEGVDLFDLLAAVDKVPAEIAALIAAQVAEGLEYAHYRGIVHRDIKPSNVLISKKGEVKLMDFGIARDPGKSELTQVGLAVGTPAYMAPEQIRGDRIDFRTDIFALGIVLYEMLAGDKPWAEEEGRSVTVKVLDEPCPPIRRKVPDIAPELEHVLERCLAKDPAQRYRSTYELRRDLSAYVQRVVPVDPRGRLVLYLRNRGLVSETEAASLVEPGLLGDATVRRRDEGIPPPPASLLLRPVMGATAISLLVVAAAGLLSRFVPLGTPLAEERPRVALVQGAMEIEAEVERRVRARLGEAPATETKPALMGNEGFVKVLVKPWARVFVDGKFHDYTPFAEPLALSPGRHRIGLRNPYFQSVDHFLDVTTGQTEVLSVTLAPKPEGVDAP